MASSSSAPPPHDGEPGGDGRRNSADIAHTSFWLRAGKEDGSGQYIEIRYKAYLYTDGSAFWSVRGPLLALLGDRTAKLNVAKEMKAQCVGFEVFLHQLGLQFVELYAMSWRQVACREDMPAGAKCREEATISTLGLLLLHLWWSRFRRRRQCRDRVATMLAAFLSRCFGDREFRRDALLEVVGEAGRCASHHGDDALCCHVRESIGDHLIEAGGKPLFTKDVAAFCALLAGHFLHCAPCMRILKSSCESLASGIEGALPDLGLDTDALAHAFLPEPKRKRHRVDEDYKAALTERVVKRRRCHGKSAVLNMHGINSSACSRWDHIELLRYQRSAWRAIGSCSGIFCLQHDGARVGQPARESVTMILQHNATDVACYLPPQAARVHQKLVSGPARDWAVV